MVDLAAGAAELHDTMAAHIATGRPPGLVMALERGDEQHVDVIGSTTLEGAEPVRRGTIFRIASMTKPVAAVATMILVEEGLLALDAPVDDLLPELADRRVLRRAAGPLDDTVAALRPITLADLLTFRWGYGARGDSTPLDLAAREQGLAGDALNTRRFGPDEWLRRLGTLPLQAQPGERWSYDVGFDVLSVLLARATGGPLATLLAQRIFDPLGMVDTGFSVPADQRHRFLPCYAVDEATGEQRVADPVDGAWSHEPLFPSASGGLVSTIDDYLAFARMLRGPDPLVSPATLALMTTDHLTPAQRDPMLRDRGWGLGMAVGGGGSATRYGWDGITGTVWFNDSAQRSTAILLTQQSAGDAVRPMFQDFRDGAGDALAH
ncbi:serine hydrolase domain-containing protein [Pseudonocardia sp. GCM10023141]|uniref:serine hydrolase domain-containing protein n=1 Tax=Pseudonocardia sp. GCM10023141 TaxID=3252653 RepID=UPI00361D31BD